jgi:transcriptional regulator with PAS, ATPase and Fis domain
MTGFSQAMRRVYDFIDRVGPAEVTVLIQGESGTGKELAARAIHRASPRGAGPFVAVNCAAIPDQLLESELFGYARGAFSGAVADKKGRLEMAQGGTLFLDEIGELPLALQAKMLRALQECEFERVGGTRSIRVDMRVIAATNVDLRAAVQRGAFREDLYYRLDVVSMRMPALRERPEDILPLADLFLAAAAGPARTPPVLSPQARNCLAGYHWPGNVRELQNALARAVVLRSAPVIEPADLPEAVTRLTAVPETKAGFGAAVRQFKRQLILDSIRKARGNFTEAARLLDVNPCYLHRLVRVLDLRDRLTAAEPARADPIEMPLRSRCSAAGG